MKQKTLLLLGGVALAYWWFKKQTPTPLPAPPNTAPGSGNSVPVAPA